MSEKELRREWTRNAAIGELVHLKFEVRKLFDELLRNVGYDQSFPEDETEYLAAQRHALFYAKIALGALFEREMLYLRGDEVEKDAEYAEFYEEVRHGIT